MRSLASFSAFSFAAKSSATAVPAYAAQYWTSGAVLGSFFAAQLPSFRKGLAEFESAWGTR